ncbi:MAG: hypothetical protein WD851_17195 [Pirellulales bacterium]
MPDHEAAALFPINDADLKRLTKSIEQFGLQIPVALYEDRVLDGRCRIKACVKLGLPVLVVRFGDDDLNGLSPKQWVLHRNRTVTDGRRMTDAEYALIVASVYGPHASEQARERQKGGVKLDSEIRGPTNEVLGTLFNISPNLMKQALTVFKSGDTALIEMVKNKKLSLSKAAEISPLPEAKKKAALQNLRGPAPLTSTEDARNAFKRAVTTLVNAEKRIQEITESEHFSARNRMAIQPSLAKLRDAVSELEKSQNEKASAASEA